MTKKSCCFFGKTKLGYQKRDKAFELLYRQIEALIKDGYTEFILSGHGDFDSTARIAVISLRMRFPNIKTIYYHACKYEDNQALLQTIYPPIEDISQHQAIVYRNYAMIDSSDYCIFYVVRNKSGAVNKAIKYAIKNNKPYINLADILSE